MQSNTKLMQLVVRLIIEHQIEEKLKKQAKRYNKKYPGEMVHFGTKRLPLLKGESPKVTHDYLFIGIDDFSRELFGRDSV
jgi:hypothetical protein